MSKPEKISEPLHVVRVRLPHSGSYASCPSGDTEYDEAYDKALKAAIPIGFEPVGLRIGHYWPEDSEGFTWVPLRCTDESKAVRELRDRVATLEARLVIGTALARQLAEHLEGATR